MIRQFNSTGRTPSPNAPEIRDVQFGGGRIGDIKDSVNMFRGDVNNEIPLFQIPSRNGFDIEFTLAYQSNVQGFVDTWNLEAPTGTLGLGWALGFHRIAVDGGGSAAPTSNTYYLIDGGRAEKLIPRERKRSGEIVFEPEIYRFWSIEYEPNAERWTITKTDGTRYIYGGKDDGGDTVQWGVAWGAQDAPNWAGPSAKPDGQRQYAVAWDLARAENLRGDTLTYAYDTVMQKVGGSGDQYRAYTKASYLKTITDTLGRQVILDYKEKIYDPHRGICEYQDPHKALQKPADAGTPDAYQSRYETRYLDRVRVNDQNGDELFSYAFDYDLRNFSSTPDSDDKARFFYKRCLTGVRRLAPDGDAVSGHVFDYWPRSDEKTGVKNPHPGAIKSITYPSGGTATYVYQTEEVTGEGVDPRMPLRHRIDAPWSGGKVTPRVWFGPDYTVVTWYDGDRKALGVYVYRWAGRWITWRASETIQGEVDMDSLVVVPRQEFFCLTFINKSQKKQNIHLFRKDNSRLGAWSETDVSTSLNDLGTLTLVAAGSGHIMLCNPGFPNSPYHGWSWSPFARAWKPIYTLPDVPSGDDVRFSVTGRDNYFLTASFKPDSTDKDKGTAEFTLIYQDPAEPSGNGWKIASTWRRTITVFGASDPKNQFFFSLTGGATFAVATYITAARDQPREVDYTLLAYAWDARYHVPDAEPFSRTYTAPAKEELQLPVFGTKVLSNAMVANSGNLLRYVGGMDAVPKQTWTTHDREAGAGGDFTFAQALDAGVIYNADGGGTAALTTFDPKYPSAGGWKSRGLGEGEKVPTMAGDYMSLGSAVHYRGPKNDWEKLANGLGHDVAPDTVENRAPFYFLYEDTSKRAVHVAFVANGEVRKERETLNDPAQRCHVDGGKLGTDLAGISMFATYPADEDFDSASKLYLYQVVDQTVTGKVVTRDVERVRIDDAWPDDTPYEQHYRYDPSDVTYDAQTAIAQFAKATLLPGSSDGKHGYSVTHFSNGLSSTLHEQTGHDGATNYNHLLNGIPLRQETYDRDGAQVSATTRHFQVYRTRLTGVGGGSTNVAGAWVRQVRENDNLDGVERTRTYEWDRYSGQVQRQTRDDYDDDGKQVALSDSYTYGYDVASYRDWMVGRNALDVVVAEKKKVDDTIISVAVTTWKAWYEDRWAKCLTARWKGTGSPDFNFKDWSGGDGVSDDWVIGDKVLTRTQDGLQVTSRANVDGVVSSVAYSKQAMRPVATFPAADSRSGDGSMPGDAAYWGLESYEVNPGWTVEPGGGDPADDITQVNPRVGAACLKVPGDTAQKKGPQLEAEPCRQDQIFILSCWVRNGSDFKAGEDAAWHIDACKPDGSVVSTQTSRIPATDGAWNYLSIPIDLAKIRKDNGIGDDTRLRLRLHARNGTSAAYYLDALRLTPLQSDFTATTFGPGLLQASGKVGPRGEVSDIVHDKYMREIAQTGPAAGDFNDLRAVYQAGAKAGDSETSMTDRDSVLSIQPFGRGVFDDFRTAEVPAHWSGDRDGAWTTDPEHRVLSHAKTNDPESLALTPTDDYGAYGVQLTVLPRAEPQSAISLVIGDALSVGWAPDEGGWVLRDASGKIVDRQEQSALASGRWTVVIDGAMAMFFFDGRQIFGHDFGSKLSGTFAIKTAAAVDFKAVCAFPGPSMTMQYRDGAGRERQSQVFDSSSWIVSEVVFDSLGREAIQTKPVPREGTTFGLWPDFVTGVAWDGDGSMTGAVSDYYSSSGGGFTNDEGYPFSRTAYEPSPVSREVEKARPGKVLALGSGSNADGRHTLRRTYSKNEGLHHLPPGKYFQTTITGEDGHKTIEIENARKHTLLKQTPIKGPDGADEGSLTLAYKYDAAGYLTEIKLPNAFQPRQDSDAGKAVMRIERDFFGRVLEEISYNRGDPGDTKKPKAVRYMYDKAGRERFYQTPDLQQAGRIGYFKYDRLGRQVESGETDFDWNDSTQSKLEKHASDPDWPKNESRWTEKTTYDGDGSRPDAIGYVVESRSKAAGDSSAGCIERFTYDIDGRVDTKTLSVPGFDGTERTLAYTYDAHDNITSLTVSDGSDDHTVTYGHNAFGAVTAVGRSESEPACYASYSYYPTGSTKSETLNASSGLVRTFEYNSPAWTTRISDDKFFEQRIAYYGGQGTGGYYDGKPAQITLSEKWRESGDALTEAYKYDSLGRVRWASGDIQGSDQTTETFSYDANGNALEVKRNGQTRTGYSYDGYTDRVKETTGEAASSYTYNLDGDVTGVPGRNLALTFDKTTGRVATATVSGQDGCDLGFSYDRQGHRVLATGVDGQEGRKRLYIRDFDGNPLMELTSGGQDGASKRLYVYGNDGGLMAMEVDGQRYFVLRDVLGSSRVVIDDDLTFKAGYRYGLYGEQVATDGDTSLLRYLYTGQELDRETGLYNYNARLYDPQLRRFYSIDPEQQFASPYVYVADNPLTYKDPSGRALSLLAVVVIGAIVGAVAGLAAGVAAAVHNNWSAGEAVWKTAVLTVLGAVSGAIFGAAAYGAAAAGSAAVAAAGWSAEGAGGILLSGSIELGGWAVAGTALGASDGATHAWLTGSDVGEGAGYGALSGLIGSVAYFGASKFAGAVGRAVVRRSLRGRSLYKVRQIGRDEITDQPIHQVMKRRRVLRRGAIAESIAGFVGGAGSAVAGQSIDIAKGRTSAEAVIRNTLLGGIFGAARSGQYWEYRQAVRAQQVPPSLFAARREALNAQL